MTSNGGKLSKVNKDQIVLVMVEDKINPIGVGRMEMNDDEIRSVNSGMAIQMLEVIGDDLWNLDLTKI